MDGKHVEHRDRGFGGGTLWTSLALDAAGNPHISYFDNYNNDLKYAKWTGSAWHREAVDSEGDVGYINSIALDAAGYPHICYIDWTPNYNLKYAKWTGSAWSIETVDSVTESGTSLALDAAGYPHICYFDRDNGEPKLKYAKWTGSAWSIEIVDSAFKFYSDASIALDADGYPHISYYGYVIISNRYVPVLKYAKWTGSTWSIENVDLTDYFDFDVRSTSIALDAAGYPHICYCDEVDEILKYARWTGSTWSIETVDSATYASIALDAAGYPHISYFDWGDSALKYAVKGLGIPTIVTLQGKLTDSTTGSTIQTGSMRVTIKDWTGMQVWQDTCDDVLDGGIFNIPLGAVHGLKLIPDSIYQMEIEIDADSALFSTADVTFGDGSPSGDVIKFKA